MILRKHLSLAHVQFKLQGDAETFTGYASTFGNVDSYGDTIVKGAYVETLAKHGLPKMFFNHNSDAVPIGKYIKAEEDNVGLLLTGEFTPGHALAAEVKAGIKHGTLDSMSIGYRLRKGDFEDHETGRIIKKVDRLLETSIVTFPADTFAQIDHYNLKSVDFEELLPECKSEKDIEQLLRDSGLGKWEAMAIVSRVKAIAKRSDSGDVAEANKHALILDRLQKLAA
jgi:uncharacterized protein